MDKSTGLKFARDMHRIGFKLYATPGTAYLINSAGLPVETVEKAQDGSNQIVDLILQWTDSTRPEHAAGSARAY